MARVAVGMPVHNGAATFERALTSVLGQTMADLEVIISDNCSTDGTAATARRHAARDARIRYVRQERLLSAYDNFRFVLEAARAPYFLWAAADDHPHPTLLARACDVLDSRPDVVACVPRVDLVDAGGGTTLAAGTFPLLGTPRQNVAAFLANPADNSRLYGLFRRLALLRAAPRHEFYAADWAISLATLLDGKHVEVPEVLLVREASDPLKYMHLIDRHYGRHAARFLALLPFTRYVLWQIRPPLSARALLNLLRLNLWFHVAYCRWRYPWYGRPAHRLADVTDRALAKILGRAGRPVG